MTQMLKPSWRNTILLNFHSS